MSKKFQDSWIRIPKDAAEYCAISERTLEDWIRAGLRYAMVGRCRITKAEWIDQFIMQHEASKQGRVDQIVNSVLRGM